jgi:hypothetical protein
MLGGDRDLDIKPRRFAAQPLNQRAKLDRLGARAKNNENANATILTHSTQV